MLSILFIPYCFNISIYRVFRHTSRPRSPLPVSSAPPTPFRTMEQEGRFDDPRFLPASGSSLVKNKPESGIISDVSVSEMHQYLTILVEASKKAFKLIQRSSDPKISRKGFLVETLSYKVLLLPHGPNDKWFRKGGELLGEFFTLLPIYHRDENGGSWLGLMMADRRRREIYLLDFCNFLSRSGYVDNMREVLRLEDVFKKSVGEPKDRDFEIRRIPFSNFTENRKLCPQMMICLLAREVTETGEQLLHSCRGVKEGGFLAYDFKKVKPLARENFV
jgi:hypothetical protein